MATGNKPPPFHAPHYQYGPVQNVEDPPPIGDPDHQLCSYGHIAAGTDFTGPYPAFPTMSHVNYAPLSGHTGNMGYEGQLHPTAPPPECHGSQTHCVAHPTLGKTQYIPVTLSHPEPEYSVPVVPELAEDGTFSCVSPPHNAAGPSRDSLAPVHPGISTDEDLKRLARHYLLSLASRVDKLRMRRSRSGALKVLILLEIEDMM